MMNMFQVQMDMFLKHHSAAKEQEQEFLKTQQIEVRTTQKEFMDNKDRPVFFSMYCPHCQSYLKSPKWHHFFFNSRKLWKITTFHQGSGCRHCKQVWMDR